MSNLHETLLDGAARAERRNITVLFCDIVGSSALATKLDPEDLREILSAFRECCESAISQYDGHVARYMGDGVLAYFGFPVAHEDDAERAVNAALRMVSSISALAFAAVPRFDVRIAIATGLVVVGDLIGEGPSREFAVIGEAPNLAASLQQLARPNEILITPQTRRLLGRLFDLEDVGEHKLKGQEQALRISRVLRPSPVRSRFDAHQVAGLTPFVGRSADLRVLQECFEKAVSGEGQIVTITGEPGIGKSRLIANFCDAQTRDAYKAILLQCSPHHASSPWYPFIRYLEHAAGIEFEPSASSRLECLERFVKTQLGGESYSIIPLLAALLSIPVASSSAVAELTPQQQKSITIAALIRLIRAQTDQQPVVLICEDLHWVDPSSFELLDQLRKDLMDRRVLFLLSSRPEFSIPWSEQSNIAAISMKPLDTAQTRSLVGLLAGERGLPKDLVDQIVAKTDGVPLFVEEVTKSILESRAGPGEPVSIPTVPDTLHDSLMARLDRLAPMKMIAQTAAVIGREFQLALLEAVATATPDDVRRAIEALLAAGLLYERGPGTRAYAFNHALVQDAAYSSLLREERRRLHVRIATALQERFSEITESQPELVAYHYSQAQDIESAIRFWLKAGQQASKRSAFVEASIHLQTALRQISELPQNGRRDEVELQLLESFASASIAAKGFGATETMQALVRALELCERTGDRSRTLRVLNGMVGVHMMRGEFEKSLTVSQSLLERAETQNDTTALLMGHRVLGMSLFVLGRLEEGCRHLRKAVDLYEPGRHAPLALVYSQDLRATAEAYLGLAAVVAGRVDDGLRHGLAALAYAEELRHPHSICYVLPFLTGAYLVGGRTDQALAAAERTIALSSQYVFPQWQAGGLMLRGWARIELGEISSGIADIRRSIAGLEATGTMIWMRFAQFQLARGLSISGDRQAALELIERALRDLAATSGRWYEAEVHRFKGDLMLESGRPVEAEHCYEAAIASAKRQGARLFQLRAMNALIPLRLTRGNLLDLQDELAFLCKELGEGNLVEVQTAAALLSRAPVGGTT